jgi:seryl-tRNA synthetase
MPTDDSNSYDKDREQFRRMTDDAWRTTRDAFSQARDRSRGVIDDLAGTAQRIRTTAEDVGLVEDLRKVAADLQELARRLSQCEPEEGSSASSVPTTAQDKVPSPRTRHYRRRGPYGKSNEPRNE